MVLQFFAVKDIKGNIFNRPFPEINQVNAIRGLSVVVNDPNSQISHFPQDFELFRVGTFNDETGIIIAEERPVFIESAFNLKKLQKEIDNVQAKINAGADKTAK